MSEIDYPTLLANRDEMIRRQGEELAALRKKSRMFPLQTSRHAPSGPRQIPWTVAEIAYGEYSKRYGSSQSLERLAERGGFGWCEMDDLHPTWRKEVSEIARLEEELAALRKMILPFGDGSEEIRWMDEYAAMTSCREYNRKQKESRPNG